MRKLILSIMVVGSLFAEPSKVISYLMDEPASLLDIGIYKIEKNLEIDNKKFIKEIKYIEYVSSSVFYSWENDTINIYRTIDAKLPSKKGNDEKLCKIIIEDTKEYFIALEDQRNKTSYKSDRRNFGIASYFKHSGYKKNIPNDFTKKIEQRTKILVSVYTDEKYISCQSKLLDDGSFVKSYTLVEKARQDVVKEIKRVYTDFDEKKVKQYLVKLNKTNPKKAEELNNKDGWIRIWREIYGDVGNVNIELDD